MATIRMMENDLFHHGLVDPDREIYRLIAKAVRRRLKEELPMIDRTLMESVIHSYRDKYGHNGVSISSCMELPLFIDDINVCSGKATAEVHLSLPIAGNVAVSEHDNIWNLIQERLRIPDVEIRNGELYIKMPIGRNGQNIKQGDIIDGRKSFFTEKVKK